MREAYFARKVPELNRGRTANWVELSDGLPFAALAELVISVCCLGNDLEETAKLLKSLDAHNPSSLEFASSRPRMERCPTQPRTRSRSKIEDRFAAKKAQKAQEKPGQTRSSWLLLILFFFVPYVLFLRQLFLSVAATIEVQRAWRPPANGVGAAVQLWSR